jgi:hypothetical protein
MRRTPLLLLLALLAGCGSDTVDHRTDARADSLQPDGAVGNPDAPSDAVAATLSIYIKGDKTAKAFSDGYSGQTPKVYTMGLGRFDIMTSASDPSPVTVFDHGAKPVDVDLLAETLGGAARLADLAAGSYTHGRVLLTSSTFTVQATVHAAVALPGEITMVAALSDTTINGQPWNQGQATITFAAGGPAVTVPATLPPLPSTGGGTIVQEGGRPWLVFPFPKPIVISPSANKSHRATIVYQVFESFRWEDQTKAGFQDQIFDVDALGSTWEPVHNYGATGYAIELD